MIHLSAQLPLLGQEVPDTIHQKGVQVQSATILKIFYQRKRQLEEWIQWIGSALEEKEKNDPACEALSEQLKQMEKTKWQMIEAEQKFLGCLDELTKDFCLEWYAPPMSSKQIALERD